ncbi:50S ribosomal protein L15 [Candidatus Daviesbacteria bacterium RIFCSPLOWO2_02_FULL_40_8]|uniref:Large ribosomal subunit protein uL15 n=1 Tax=Candidatus Daviesbacteria bacterium RIFCSPLOWO2_01_FULL_40_24 TaxID=1797787 RepID=A0A1F5MJZ7_9BACT|nr:MAG: 50S ribosomal protein L15 [Candidatus Daviesbacteria bacterium RIFCSPHIGHO2_01_FULL_41_45]OGE35396.1 MAG: 50S ribosomal protein L15 [Candidatus Daviesbacteria bacterium RIFCSPHIGHO2_02_FULL_41_14]OGE65639.1 MAG: 50S ribosomal protein L15 [Candidatus Daviesbacteria bacterium RIFCSPLOWO2_01_FULL_40_24]OGE66318.1 MAG: 50S ribosomal protein L15 [Candidatus Daviesbacteria bacterium RIFCSPLOWO2_02_FULL_40_8]
MKLHQLPKLAARSGKRLGRGAGSGKGKTSARGTKGQKARGKVALGFIGGTLAIYKKLPFKRGLGNSKVSPKFLPVSVEKLSIFKSGTEITVALLIESKIVDPKDALTKGVKLVGKSDLRVPLNVVLPTTASAKSTIIKAGGKVLGV